MYEALQPVYLLFIVIILFVVSLPALVKVITVNKRSNKLPYKKKYSPITKHEQAFFRKLEQQYGEQFYIFCQVSLSRLIKTDDKDNFYTYWNKINKKSIDFVLVNKETFETEKLIELNDKSHNSKKRQQRDEFLSQVCEAAGMELEFVTEFKG